MNSLKRAAVSGGTERDGGTEHECFARRRTRYSGSSSHPWWLLLLAAISAVLVVGAVIFLIIEISTTGTTALFNILTRPRIYRLLGNTLLLVVTVTAGAMLLGVLNAVLLRRFRVRAAKLWLIASTLPLAIPSYVAGYTWVSLTPLREFWGSVIVLVLATTPYVTLPVVSALRRVDLAPEAVARTLGASPLQAFCRTTLPQILPAAAAGGLLVALYTVSDFGVVAIMRYPAFTWAIQTAFGGSFNRPLAVTLALALVFLALVLILLERAVRKQATHRSAIAIKQLPREVTAPKQAAIQAYFLVLALLGIGIPVVALLIRLSQSIAANNLELDRLLQAALTTVLLGFTGAAVATLLALPIAVLAAANSNSTVKTGFQRAVSVVETVTYLGHGLPGIVLGLTMVYFTLAVIPAAYQSIAALIVAYGILFTPKAAGSARTSLTQIPPELPAAARVLGRSAGNTWATVTARLALPGIATGALLVALTVMKELPATLMLRPTGTDTLATRLWQLTDSASYGAAAPYAIALIAVASVPALLLTRESERFAS